MTTARIIPAESVRGGALTDRTIASLAAERKLIDPFDPTRLSGAAYDVSVGVLVTSRNRLERFRVDKEPYVIESGECVTLESLERFDFLGSLCVGVIVNKHSILARGLFHPSTSIDPGFRGTLALTFFNLGRERFELSYGMAIAKIVFIPIGSIPARLYGATQQPSYRQGSTEIALIVERSATISEDQVLRKMYGRPVENLYERLNQLESNRELSSLRIADAKRRHRLRLVWELFLSLISGAGGALLITNWDDIWPFIKSLF